MIHYFTSVSKSWQDIIEAARDFRDEQPFAGWAEQPARMNHREEFDWGDAILAAHEPGRAYVVAATSELALLRILRRVREGLLPPDQILVHCLQERTDLPPVVELRVNGEGEFIDRWPEGFFDGRVAELF